jgi:hypothetical protein
MIGFARRGYHRHVHSPCRIFMFMAREREELAIHDESARCKQLAREFVSEPTATHLRELEAEFTGSASPTEGAVRPPQLRPPLTAPPSTPSRNISIGRADVVF